MADDEGYTSGEEDSILTRATSLALAPIRILTSPTAVTTYLSVLLFLVTSGVLLAISSTAYGIFYYNYIPQISLSRPLYLQYAPGTYPYATVSLPTSTLISTQPYDVSIILSMPRTPSNLDAGNFMLDLSLLGPGISTPPLPDPVSSLLNLTTSTTLHHSRRPTILPFSSPLLGLSSSLLRLPLHLTGFRDLDTSRLTIPMFELLSFDRGSTNVPTHARLELQSESVLQVYSVSLDFQARFRGMRYLVYNYRITSYLVFTTVFYCVSITTMALAWAFVSTLLRPTDAPKGKRIKQEGDGEQTPTSTSARIKTEEDSSSSAKGLSLSNLSDTPAQYPTWRGQRPLAFPGRSTATGGEVLSQEQDIAPEDVADDEEDEGHSTEEQPGRLYTGDSGIGTSMESEHAASGAIRRRSSRQSLGNR